jgi:RNA polymerase sigma factor (sigma-70 family)
MMSAVGATIDRDVEIYRRYSVELVRYATVLVGPSDAADVVEDAVLGAFAAPRWREVANPRAYLYRAVLNRALGARRSTERRRRREHAAAAASSFAPAEPSIDAHRALAQLSPQQRAVVYLTYWDDRSTKEIAALLDISDGSVRKQLARARDQLRRILDA